jgi:hypothetical protein
MHNVTDLLVAHAKLFLILVQKCFSHKNDCHCLEACYSGLWSPHLRVAFFTYIENWGFAAMVCFVKDTRREGSVGLCEGA